MLSRVLVLLLATVSEVRPFVLSSNGRSFVQRQTHAFSPVVLHAGTTQSPLYDGTNYTFPDTTTPDGIAEVLEVSFVNACMQLRTGFVDILKLFIAGAMGGYEVGFPIPEIDKALAACSTETANRPLMQEEINLRRTWVSLVYLTLSSLGHRTRVPALTNSIPTEIQKDYGELVAEVADAYERGEIVTLEALTQKLPANLSEMERALRSQSLRVVTLTVTVLDESEEGRIGEQMPPPPPIENQL